MGDGGTTGAEHANHAQATPPRSFGSSLRLTVLGAILPGAGYLAAGRRLLGIAVLSVLAAGVLTFLGVLLYESDLAVLGAELASRPRILTVLGFVVVAAACAWVLVIVTSHLMLRPRTASAWQRGAGVALVLALCAAVVAPSMFVARSAWATRDVVEEVFPSVPEDSDDTTPEEPVDRDDPWKGMPRLNILLLGGDSGEGRDGLRTDTMIVASVDTHTGDTVLFSLPRNLQNVPFPADNPLHEVWPEGYRGGSGSSALLLNGVYREAEENYPALFPDDPNPGMSTLRGVIGEVTGLEIDYHVLINLEGFERMVDALGGIDINVGPDRVPIGGLDVNGNPQPDYLIEEWIEPGFQHLNGYEALWFARDRRDTDDYNRMRRQRCVINALVEEVSPTNVVTHYIELAQTAGDIISTDVPRELLPALVELAYLVRSQPVRSLPFTDDIITTADPDFDLIRRLVDESLDPPPPAPTESATGTPGVTAAPTDPGAPTTTTTTPAPDPTVAVAANEVCG